MKLVFAILSILSLVGTIAPSLLYLAGRMELPTVKNVMLAATVAWFVFAALWIYGKKPSVLDSPVVP